ncbi:hypothetical protein L3Q82_021839, partial [Scortum barcoo]
APDTTQALLLTEGSISTVQPASLSDLSNITVIGLSHNHISVLGKQSFRNLPSLHTLLLDHNLLTSQALQGGALTNLTQLQVLALGHNLISMIQGGWFKGSKALRSLTLEGNLLTNLDSDSFPVNDLRDLEKLDLSDNLIDHLDRDSFGGLVSLQTLDLSRNRLRSAPAEAFSYLSWLTNLNLDLNSWNCSCQLLELAAFLSTFMQQPDKTLYNGRRMVCVSADNPAVTTVLELTEANCVPSNQNITVQIETRGSVMPQLYARDLAITAVICFIGGVGLTLLVVLIYYQVSRRKKLKDYKRQKEEEEGNSAAANHHVNHIDVSEKRRELFLQANSSQPWDREAMMLDARTSGHDGQFRSRADENHSHFRCPDCRMEGQRGMGPDSMRENRTNGGMEAEEERERRRMRMMTEEEKWRLGTPWDIPNRLLSHGNTNSSSHQWKETLSQRPETLAAYRTNREMGESHRTDMEGKSRGHESLHCEGCHRTYRAPELNTRQGRGHAIMRDSALFDGFPSQFRETDRGRNVNHNQFDMMKNTEWRRETRNVRFDLDSSGPPERGNSRGEEGRRGKRKEEERTAKDEERGEVRRHKAKVQSSRLLKVKLNLNPLRKSKVHPKRKAEQGHSEKSSSKKSKDKRRDGKEREEKEWKGKSGKTTKSSSEKMKKSATAKGLTKDGKKENEEEDKGGGKGQKSKTSFKQKKTTSKSEQCSQESTEGDKGGNSHLENLQPADTSSTADQSTSANATRQGQHLQGGNIQYQGAGLVMGNAQLSLQHPLSRSVTDRNHTANLSLLGPAGSQLTGSSLSQGGNSLLNTMASGSNAVFPSYPANSVAQSIAISGPSMAPSGVPGSFSRQAGVGLLSPATSLLSNSVHANLLQANVIHTSSPHTSQPAGLASSLAANLAVNPAPVLSLSQSQPPPDSSPLVAIQKSDPVQGPGLQTGEKLHQLVAIQKSDPVQGPGLQTGEKLHQLPPESQAPQDKESLPLPIQEPSSVDVFSGVTPQASESLMTVENLSNNNSQAETGRVPPGSTVSISAGGVALSERLPVGVSGGSMQAADVPLSGVSAPGMSTQSVSTTGDAAAAAALVQQEYLSEEGGSSPRRKLRLVLPEKTSSRPPTALERKIR